MGRPGEWFRRIRYLVHRDRLERELQQEMETHRLMMSEPARFGNELRLRETARDAWGWEFFDRFTQDLRVSARRILASKGYAAAVVLTLALGIGVNTAVFSMIDGFTLRTLPYKQPERVAALVVHREGIYPGAQTSRSEEDDSFDGATWKLLRDNIEAVTFAAWGGSGGINLRTDASGRGTVVYTEGSRVSADYFDVVGISMHMGRSFTQEEDTPGGPAAAVLSYRIWKSIFGSDPQIIGNSLELKGERHTIVGVLAPSAVTPSKADVFTPLRPAMSGECGGNNCGVLVRLKAGRTWPELNAQLKQIRLPFFDELETRYHGHAFLYARPLQLQLAGSMANRTVVLMFAVSFILAIACANLAGLVLVRISRRTHEIATLLALGARTIDVLRQLWLENLVLALIGGAGGVGIAWLILGTLHGFLPDWMIPIGGFPVDGAVIAFAIGAALVASLLFGALPALRARRIGIRSSMGEGSRTVAGGSVRWRQWLIGTEVALTVVLLAAAGLMTRTLIHLETVPAGFDAHNVMTAKVSLDDAKYRDENAFHALLDKSVASMKQIPGVEEAAIGLSVPYERGLNTGFAIVDGARAGTESGASLAYITNGYFSTLRIPLLAGRIFDDKDNATSLPVAIINAGFGKRFFNSASPIGNHIRVSKTIYEIVGVVADVAKRPGMTPNTPMGKEPVIYLPAVQTPQQLVNIAHIWFQPSWIVRTAGPVTGLIQSMQHALADGDPGLPFAGFYSMEDILAEQLRLQRVEVVLFTTLAALALLLSAIGIYALVSNLVVQRRREIGIRIALGSGIRRIMVDVGGSGVVAALVGLLAGFILSLAVLRVLSSEIYGTSANDPVTLASVMFVLTVTAIAASLLPTLRISRIQPAETLYAE